MPQNSKMLIGAVVAAALAFAVYYGLLSPQAANTIQTQTNQTLGTTQAGPQTANPTAPSPTVPAPQSPAPPARP